jgi:hypothetical protein
VLSVTHIPGQPFRFMQHPQTDDKVWRYENFEKCPYFVIPAKAGIQKIMKRLDSRLRGIDNLDHMRRNSKVSISRPKKEQFMVKTAIQGKPVNAAANGGRP